MSNRRPDTEVLVHTTAPSRGADDVAYRNLATAYLSFEPVARTSLGSIGHTTAHDGATGSSLGPALGFRPDRFASPELSFGSVMHNLNSPRLPRNPAGGMEDGHESQLSWGPPPSVIEDSIPDNNISIARYSSPTRILEHYLQGFESSSQSNPSQSLPPAGAVPSSMWLADQIPLPTEPTRADLAANGVRDSPIAIQVVPQTPSASLRRQGTPLASSTTASDHAPTNTPMPVPQLPEITSSGEAARSQNQSVLAAVDTTVIPSSLPASTAYLIPSSRADSEPPPPRAKRQKRSLSGLNPNTLARSTSDIGPRQEDAKRSQLARRQRARQTADGLEVHSPEPPVGCDHLTVSSVVTKKLQKLARDVDIRKRFQPKEQKRELRPFERGYWLVDCSAWPDGVGRDAWRFLTNYVSTGDAGWGIWCRRAEDYSWIRLYCWGCAVGHMHLLLYLASRRELNYTRTTWMGGDGQVLVVMEPKYQRM